MATPYRHGGKAAAESFFLNGMTLALRRLAEQAHPGFPVTVYYAFKQSESRDTSGARRTGWETFLHAVIQSGFAVTGTWPVRTELANKIIGINANILASSIVLVCRRRPDDAPTATRRECVTALRTELPPALRLLQTGNVAPVDLAQAAIGPGMAVYTRYARVLAMVVDRCGASCGRRRNSRLIGTCSRRSWSVPGRRRPCRGHARRAVPPSPFRREQRPGSSVGPMPAPVRGYCPRAWTERVRSACRTA